MPRTGRPPRPAAERFYRQTRAGDGGCIEWTGFLDRDGYGQFRPGGRDSSKVRSHRWAYEHQVGAIPEGLVIDHLCRNRACVNPDHLEPVTPHENNMRSPIAPSAVNAKKTHCLNGHPFSGDNLRVFNGKRSCRACSKARAAAYYQQKKAS